MLKDLKDITKIANFYLSELEYVALRNKSIFPHPVGSLSIVSLIITFIIYLEIQSFVIIFLFLLNVLEI